MERSSRPRRRLESECSPLVGPRHRKINEALETVAARQASFDCRLRRCLAQGKRATRSMRIDELRSSLRAMRVMSNSGGGRTEVRPTSDRRCQERRAGSPRVSASAQAPVFVDRAMDDLAPAIRRWRRRRKRQSLHVSRLLSSLRQSDLDRRTADRDAIDQVRMSGAGLDGLRPACRRLRDERSIRRRERGRSIPPCSCRLAEPPARRSSASAWTPSRPRWAHPVAVIVERPSRQQSLGRLCHVAVPRAQSVGGSGIVRPLRLRSATWSLRHREARGEFGRR